MARSRYLLVSTALIATTALLVFGYAAFHPKTYKVLAQGMPPVGSYGFLVTTLRTAPQTQAAAVGVINFDGGGVVNGSFKSYDPGSGQVFFSGTFNGNYSSSADGTGSFTIVDSSGATTQWAMVLSNSNAQISLLQIGGQSSGDTSVASGVATRQ